MKLRIEIYDYWHLGSGHGSAGYIDSMVLRDRDGLPYLPGRSLKGLLLDACLLLDLCQPGSPGAESIFGQKRDGYDPKQGEPIHFGDARLPEDHCNWLNHPDNTDYRAFLYRTIASTALKDDGTAKDKSLRTTEVSVPVRLEAEVAGLTPEAAERVASALPLIRALGKNRHRGLGRCQITLTDTGKEAAA